MATLYITTNADSGDGSLRSLIASAEAGDVIQPDPTAFPFGTPCEISVASSLVFSTAITLAGAQTRIILNYSALSNANIQMRAPCAFVDVDVIKVTKTGSGGTFWFYASAEECRFVRCLVAGCKAQSGGAFYVASGANIICDSCVFIGNYGVGSGAVAYFAVATPSDSLFSRCTFVGNVAGGNGANFNRSSTPTQNCKSDTTGLVAPPSSYTTDEWTKTLWESWDVHPLPNVAAETRAPSLDENGKPIYDFDGLARKVGGCDGAYEQVYAQLFWIGLDANGDEFEDDPYFDLATGWANSPYATACGSTTPASVSTVYVSGNLSFADQPGRTSSNRLGIVVAPNSNVSILNNADDYLDLEISRRSTFETTSKSNAIIGSSLVMLDESNLLAAFDATNKNVSYTLTFGDGCAINTYRTLYYNPISDSVDFDSIYFYRGTATPESLPGGDFTANNIRFGANGTSGDYKINFAPNTTFHAQTFQIADSDANGGSWFTNPIVLYPKTSVVSSGASNAVVDSSASYIVDLSEASGSVDLTLSGQVVRNNSNGATLSGRAKIVSETVDFSNWTIAANSELTLRNCETQVASLTVNGWNLRVESGLFSVSTLYANRNYSGSSNGASIAPDNYIEFKNLSSISLSTLALNNCKLTFNATQPTFSSATFANAILEFKNLDSVSVPSFNGDLGLKFDGVSAATFSSFNGVSLEVVDSQIVATSARLSGSLLCDGSNISVTTINAASVSCDGSTLGATTVAATTFSFSGSIVNSSNGVFTYGTSFVANNDSTITVKTLKSTERSSGVAASATLNNATLVADQLIVGVDDSVVVTGTLNVATLTINGDLTLLNSGSTDIGTLTLNSGASLTTSTSGGKFNFVVGTLNLNEDASLTVAQTTIGSATFVGDLTLVVDGTATFGSPSSSGGSLTLTAASAQFTSIPSQTPLDLSATISGSFVCGNARLASGSSVAANSIVFGALAFDSSLQLESSGATIGSVAGLNASGDALTINCGSSSVVFNGDLGTSSSPILLIASCGALSGSAFYLGDESSVDCVSLTATSLYGGGSISATTVQLDAAILSGSTTFNVGSLTVDGDFEISGSSVVYAINATNDVSINGQCSLYGTGTFDVKTLNVSELIVDGDATLTAAETITLGETSVGVGASVSVEASRFVAESISVRSAELTATVENAKIDALNLAASEVSVSAENPLAFGAINVDSGSTLTVNPGSLTVVDIDSQGTLNLYGVPDGRATVTGDFSISKIVNESSDTLYVFLPSYPETEISTVGDVVFQVLNATAYDFHASAEGDDSVVFTWKDLCGSPVTIEKVNGDGTFTTITNAAVAEYEDGVYVGEYRAASPNVNGTSFRLFDGDKYLYDVAYTVVNPAFYQYEVNAVFAPSGSTAAMTRFDNFLALARVKNSITGEYLTRSDVSSVTGTLYSVRQKNIGRYERTPVANWINVEIDPRCVLEEPTLSEMWTFDEDGFNFCWVPDQTSFDFVDENGSYEMQFRIALVGGGLAVITFGFKVE